jgi:hypothetical protein
VIAKKRTDQLLNSPTAAIMKEMQTTVSNSRDEPESMEPHFNDERTIRSAQPVVPLHTVGKERRQRRLLLGAAFVIACLLGSTVALALIRLRQPSVVADKADKAATADPKAEDTHEQAAQTNVTETSDVSLPDGEEVMSEVVESESTKAKKKARKQAAAASPVGIMVNTSPSANGQPRMVSQWEEKRQRRVNRERDPDNRQNHHSSDLFRIREIFEGPRRARRINNQ